MNATAQIEVKAEEVTQEIAEISLEALELIAGGAATVNCL